MSNSNSGDILLEELRKDEARRVAVGDVLARIAGQENRVLAHLGQMATSISFTFVRSLKWVSSDVKLAIDLPFMDALKNDEGEVEIQADNIHLVRQRPVDWSRQEELSRYLISDPLHQFPPLLLVVTSAWAEDPDDPAWVNGRATQSTYEYVPFGTFEGIVELSLDPSKYMVYALDGQHRVIGIRGAMEIVNSGTFQPKNEKGGAKGQPIQRDQWLNDDRGLDDVNRLPAETIGVHLIPGVIIGETAEEARRRISSVFVHVNQTAKPLSEGQVILIDPNDPYAAVAQRLATTDPLLKSRVDLNKPSLGKKSEDITTLSSVHKAARAYLKEYPDFGEWRSGKKAKHVAQKRPAAEIDNAIERLGSIWRKIAELPSFKALSGSNPPSVSMMRNCGPDNGAHLLFRPVGQVALFGAIADLERAGVSLNDIFTSLNRYDAAGGFRIDDFSLPWKGVIYDVAGDKVKSKGEELTRRLIAYLVNPGPPPEREELRKSFAEGRKSRDDLAWDLSGNEVPMEDVQLPNPA